MKRDLYIDYAKGLATLSIVFIHTVFWSGQFYVSNEMRIFSLLFDVPIFFALSGLTSSGNIDKTFRRLVKLQITFLMGFSRFFCSLFLIKKHIKISSWPSGRNIRRTIWASLLILNFWETGGCISIALVMFFLWWWAVFGIWKLIMLLLFLESSCWDFSQNTFGGL